MSSPHQELLRTCAREWAISNRGLMCLSPWPHSHIVGLRERGKVEFTSMPPVSSEAIWPGHSLLATLPITEAVWDSEGYTLSILFPVFHSWDGMTEATR